VKLTQLTTSLLLLASVLTLAPRLLLFFSEDPALPDPRTALSPLEAFLARFLGIWLAAISFALILNVSGRIHLLTQR
jgi:hypothetical protein